MEDPEKAKTENFTFTDALDAANEWVFRSTKLGCLSLIGIFLIIAKITGWLGLGDTPWINENELEAKKYSEMVSSGKTWVGSGVNRVILKTKWVKKK